MKIAATFCSAKGEAKLGTGVYTVNNKTIYYANILSARKGCKGSVVGGVEGADSWQLNPSQVIFHA